VRLHTVVYCTKKYVGSVQLPLQSSDLINIVDAFAGPGYKDSCISQASSFPLNRDLTLRMS
jgi:hypothetical protein